jgi:triosephosphate isomerase
VQSQLEAIKAIVDNWDNIVLAYEPVWAIGTGKTATSQQVEEIHDWIRKWLHENAAEKAEGVRIIYGGSVNEKNCDELIKIKNVDGFLVGGASLKPSFISIVKSAEHKN